MPMKPQLLQDFPAGFTPAFLLSTGNETPGYPRNSGAGAETIAELAVIP
jgi:hypothetical protein